ncbi:MAG TPA: RibD family protein [Longimicrobiales bacterium]|nr:RibD family protein [Longimicrobiales bacterium]
MGREVSLTGPGRLLAEEAAWRLLLALEPGEDQAADPVTGARLILTDPPPADGMAPGPGPRWTTEPAPSPEAARLLDIFLPLRRRAAFVVGQLGQSLDGRIATESGHSHFINGPEDIRRLHRLRALSDAVVVGAGTVLSDDPRLTVREVEGPHPVRVILDPSGRAGPARNVFTDGAAPTLWIRAEGGGSRAPGADAGSVARDTGGPAPGVEVVALPAGPGGGFAPSAVLAALAARGLRRVLVEGGGETVSRFLAAGALDRLHVSVAPLILGSGRPGIRLPPVETLEQAMRPPVRHFKLGADLLFDVDLSDPGT